SSGTLMIVSVLLLSPMPPMTTVPLLGDIPVFGNLFRDTNRDANNSKLYVFITPRVLRDPDLNVYRLISKGPFADVEFPDYIPELPPAMIQSTLTLADDEPEEEPGFVLPSDRNPSLNQRELRPADEDEN
ncbi:MAG: hypothetical protein AAFR76_13535, partial [Planctomycetota bacterium]